MNITNAKYVADPLGENQQAYISATIDGVQWSLPNNEKLVALSGTCVC